MAVQRSKNWNAGDILTASDSNAEFANIYGNGEDLGWPATKAKDLDSQQLILDGDQDTYIVATTDDRLDFFLSGTLLFQLDGTASTPVNGFFFVAGASGTDPQIQVNGGSVDTNRGMNLVPKGTGSVQISGSNVLSVEDDDSVLAAQIYS